MQIKEIVSNMAAALCHESACYIEGEFSCYYNVHFHVQPINLILTPVMESVSGVFRSISYVIKPSYRSCVLCGKAEKCPTEEYHSTTDCTESLYVVNLIFAKYLPFCIPKQFIS